jgi:hypothetical protein
LIDCNDIIQYSGALHCITHEIGVDDPIFISHAKLYDTNNTSTPYEVNAYVNTQSGVASVNLFWTIDTLSGYASLPMSSLGAGNYQAFIPAQSAGTKVFYYIEASSNSGRTIRKPLVAPEGVIMFNVLGGTTSVWNGQSKAQLFVPYPIPATDLLNVSYFAPVGGQTTISVYNLIGHLIYTVSNINAPGMQQYALDISNFSEGTYLLEFKNGEYTQMKKFIKIK